MNLQKYLLLLEKDLEFDEESDFKQKEIEDLPNAVQKYDEDGQEEDVEVGDIVDYDDEDEEQDLSEIEDDDLSFEDDEVSESDESNEEDTPQPKADASSDTEEDESDKETEEQDSSNEDEESSEEENTDNKEDSELEDDEVTEDETNEDSMARFFKEDSEEYISEENILLKFKYEIDNMADIIIKFQDKNKDDRPIEDSIGDGIKDFVEDIYEQVFDVLSSDVKPNDSATIEDFNEVLKKTEVFIGNSINDYDNFGELIDKHKSIVDDIKKWMLDSVTNEPKETYEWEDIKSFDAFSLLVGKILFDKQIKLKSLKQKVIEKLNIKFSNLFINV